MFWMPGGGGCSGLAGIDQVLVEQAPRCEILFLVRIAEPPGQTEALDEFVARLTEKRESVRRIVFRDREPTARFDDPYFVIALFVEIEGSDDPAQLVCIIVEQLELLREAARAFDKPDIAEEEIGRVASERPADHASA